MKLINSRNKAAKTSTSLQQSVSGGDSPVVQVPLNDFSPEQEALVGDGRSPHTDLPPPHEPDKERQDIAAKAPLTCQGRGLALGVRAEAPSILGWMGWVYAALYFPIVQILFLNWGKPLRLVRQH